MLFLFRIRTAHRLLNIYKTDNFVYNLLYGSVCIMTNADPGSFKLLPTIKYSNVQYAIDSGHVFWIGDTWVLGANLVLESYAIPRADPQTFHRFVGTQFSKDQNAIYYQGFPRSINFNPATFFVSSDGSIIGDRNGLYMFDFEGSDKVWKLLH